MLETPITIPFMRQSYFGLGREATGGTLGAAIGVDLYEIRQLPDRKLPIYLFKIV